MDPDQFDDFINNVKGSNSIKSTDYAVNECEIKRNIIEANKQILNENFHGWTNTVDQLITGETKKTKVLEFVKPGLNVSKWEKHKINQMEGDDMMSKIYQALYPDLTKPKEDEENNYEKDLMRIQKEKQSRAEREQVMAKCRTHKKIKAKGYRRHARKRDIKEFLRKEGGNQNTNEIKERVDRLRAEERISLKHKTSGKFGKFYKLVAKHDENAREKLEEKHNKGQELTRRFEGDEGSEDELSEGNEDDSVDEDIADEDDDDDSNMEEMAVNNSHEAVPIHPSLQNLNNDIKSDKVVTKVSKVFSTDTQMLFNQDEHIMEDSNEIFTSSDNELFKEAIYQVYQEDTDLAETFEREKAELVKKEAPQDVCTFVPGWGDWTGPGLEERDKRRKERATIKAPSGANTRSDGKKPRVWIKQTIHEGLKKHLVKKIPYPYNTAEQYELSRKQLVSSAFATESASRKLCTSRIKIKPGTVINPLRRSEKERTNE